MKKLVLFAALVMVFGLSFVSCSGGSKSEDNAKEKNNAENVQGSADLGAENVQGSADSKQVEAQ
jgi:hypothetical protein